MTDHVPSHMQEALRAFEDALADTRTRRARLEQVVLPDVEGPTAEDLAHAAAAPDAPRELRDVARAVAEGRTTWDDVLTGRASGPEAAAFQAASVTRLEALFAAGEEEDRRRLAAGERIDRLR